MENTPTGCDSHLPTNLRIIKNDRKLRSVNNSLKCSDLDPNSVKDFFWQPKLRLVEGVHGQKGGWTNTKRNDQPGRHGWTKRPNGRPTDRRSARQTEWKTDRWAAEASALLACWTSFLEGDHALPS
jgi:hypothetical protein